jgi:hypothetical protein
MAAAPAMARHKHRRGCGHVYSSAHRGWISVNVATRGFGFSFSSAPRYGRYDDRRYDPYYGRGRWDPYRYDSRYDRHRSYWRAHYGHRHGYKDRCR